VAKSEESEDEQRERQRNQGGSGPTTRATTTIVSEGQGPNGGEGDKRSDAVHNSTPGPPVEHLRHSRTAPRVLRQPLGH
jgi:hypothetical protein